jgi:CBS domain-containing protein
MDIVGTGKRVRIYIGELDKAVGHHEPLWETILELLRKEGAAGATMIRGLAGFGAHSKLHVARFADLVPDLPVLVEWIDGPERIARLLPRICDLVQTGTITLEDVDIVKYTHRDPRPVPPDRVGDVMRREVATVQPETPRGAVLPLLVTGDAGAVVVVDAQGRLLGIITNGDLMERAGLTAANAMTAQVIHVAANDPLDRAAQLMSTHGIRWLPVADAEGRLVGLLNRVDVLRTMGEDYHAPFAARPPVEAASIAGDLMRTDLPTVRGDAPLGEVLDAVTSTRLNRAIVVDAQRRVQGVITDADLLRREPAKATAADLMRTPVVSVTADTPLADVERRMFEAHHKVLPIVDADGRLLGAIDRADLLRGAPPPP